MGDCTSSTLLANRARHNGENKKKARCTGQLVGVLLTSAAPRFQFPPFAGLTGASVYSTFSANEGTRMTFNISHFSSWKAKGWLLTPCWITWACAASNADEVTHSARESASLSWATTRGPTTTKAAAPPAASSCPAAGGWLVSWVSCEEKAARASTKRAGRQ